MGLFVFKQHNLSVTDRTQPLILTRTDKKTGKQLTLIPECCNLTGECNLM